jgi:hypothetical protein
MVSPSALTIRLPRRAVMAVTATLLIGSCGGHSTPAPIQPTPIIMTVSAISPEAGPAIGGTPVILTGQNFAAPATVTIGQAVAQNVTVVDATTIMATTSPAASGPADVVVTSGGQRSLLAQGFTYRQVANSPPVISSVIALGTRANSPPGFADLDDTLNVTAQVSDAETPLAELSYEWSADIGTFSGTGASVTWTAPHNAAKVPGSYTLTLTVTERYKASDEAGNVVDRENKVSKSTIVEVHRSMQEIRNAAIEFLNDFANSSVSPQAAVRNFSSSLCPEGAADEFSDITANRAKFSSITATYGSPNAAINFGGLCTPDWMPSPGDACVDLSCAWVSTLKTGGTENASGRCYISEVYEAASDSWRLCWSHFRPSHQTTPIRLRF